MASRAASTYSSLAMDDLPTFTPVGDAPTLTAAQLEQMLPPPDPLLTAAKTACLAGDTSSATEMIEQFLRDGGGVRNLQGCLLNSAKSEDVSLIHTLLSAGVPIGVLVIEWAVAHKSKRVLAAFLEHGWNINEEMDWFRPPPLE